MVPSNPDNNQPLIYRIADALGVFHLVAPVNHTHSQSEIDGLAAVLAGKQNTLTFDSTPTAGSTNPVTSGGVKEAIDNHIVSTLTRDDFESGKYAQVFVLANGGAGVQTSTGFGVALQVDGHTKFFMVDPDTIDNLIRASQSPDSTPTDNSNNLVTSGGVKAALDKNDSINQVDEDDEQEAHLNAVAEDDDIYFKFRLKNGSAEKQVLLTMPKMDNLERALHTPDSTPTANSDNLVTSGGVKAALDEKVDLSKFSEEVDRLNSFNTSDVDEKINLPAVFDDDHYSTTYIIENYTSEDRTLDSFFNGGSDYVVCEPNKIIHPDSYVIAKVIKYNNGSNTLFFVVIEGIYEM